VMKELSWDEPVKQAKTIYQSVAGVPCTKPHL
jgi:hypothetical protein